MNIIKKEVDIELDSDNGIKKYEVDFKYKKNEYLFEIDATSGKILSKEVEKDD